MVYINTAFQSFLCLFTGVSETIILQNGILSHSINLELSLFALNGSYDGEV